MQLKFSLSEVSNQKSVDNLNESRQTIPLELMRKYMSKVKSFKVNGKNQLPLKKGKDVIFQKKSKAIDVKKLELKKNEKRPYSVIGNNSEVKKIGFFPKNEPIVEEKKLENQKAFHPRSPININMKLN